MRHSCNKKRLRWRLNSKWMDKSRWKLRLQRQLKLPAKWKSSRRLIRCKATRRSPKLAKNSKRRLLLNRKLALSHLLKMLKKPTQQPLRELQRARTD